VLTYLPVVRKPKSRNDYEDLICSKPIACLELNL